MQDFNSKLTAILATAIADCQKKVHNTESAELFTKKLIANIADNFLPNYIVEVTEPTQGKNERNFSNKL